MMREDQIELADARSEPGAKAYASHNAAGAIQAQLVSNSVCIHAGTWASD